MRIDLVYGGGSVGLMGLISETVYDGGCHVLGVIPTALMPLEMKAVQNPSEITEEVDDEMLGRIDPEIQKDRIRQIINYQKSLYISCSSSASLSSSAASCSSLSSSGKSSSLLDLMKGGSTSLSRLFDMEHTSLSTHFTEYSGPPIIKPIYLWGSDEDEDFQGLSQWTAMKTVQPIDNGSGLGSLNGFASDSSFGERDLGFAKKKAKSKHRLIRKKSFKILPGFGIWRCRGFGFKLRLRRLRVIICGRKF